MSEALHVLNGRIERVIPHESSGSAFDSICIPVWQYSEKSAEMRTKSSNVGLRVSNEEGAISGDS